MWFKSRFDIIINDLYMLKQIIKKFLSPDRLHFFRVIYSNFFGYNKIKGKKGNTLILNGAILTRCSIIFHGKNNHVEFRGGVIS